MTEVAHLLGAVLKVLARERHHCAHTKERFSKLDYVHVLHKHRLMVTTQTRTQIYIHTYNSTYAHTTRK